MKTFMANLIMDEETDLAKRIINGLCLSVVLISILYIAIYAVFDFQFIVPYSILFTNIGLFTALFLFARKSESIKYYPHIILTYSIFILIYTWINVGGIRGPVLSISFSIMMVTFIWIEFKYIVKVALFLIVVNISLFLLELQFPTIIEYPLSDSATKISSIILFVSILLMALLFIFIIRHQYYHNLAVLQAEFQEKELYKQNFTEIDKLYHILFANTNDGIGFTSFDETFVMANPAAERIFGTAEGQLLGRSLREFIPEEEFKNILVETKKREQGASSTYETYLITPRQEKRYLTVTATPVTDKDISVSGTLAIFKDITHRKEMENELRVAKEKAEESNRVKSVFLNTISHEIRTPLNAIIGFSSILEDTYPEDSKAIAKIEVIKRSSAKLYEILTDIIQVSKRSSGEIIVTKTSDSLYDFMSAIYNYFQNYKITLQKNINLDFETNIPTDLRITTDFDNLQIILKHLIYNAFKFTQSGKITIGCNLTSQDEMLFWVQDTGIGISDDELLFIFDEFRQADERVSRMYGGSGVGLTIVKNFCNALGTEIRVESQVGQGSKFWFTLPQVKGSMSDLL